MLLLSLLVFIAGVLTFLAPCTLPILPAYLVFSAQPSKTKTLFKTLAFGIGVGLVFVLFGVLAGSLGTLLALNKWWFAKATGVFLILLGIMILAGKGIPGFTVQSSPSRSLAGSFLFGIIFALSWSGCIGPVLGFVLVLAANTQTAIGGGVLLLIYAFGLLLPLLLVSLFIDKLPRNGRFWRFMKGKVLTIGSWKIQSTELITATMFILLGIIFLFGIDKLLATSSIISDIFAFEENLAKTFNIPL